MTTPVDTSVSPSADVQERPVLDSLVQFLSHRSRGEVTLLAIAAGIVVLWLGIQTGQALALIVDLFGV